jgi:(E)-4-hydroxy-3-methylbut-2-enyl-diphosphate synthase
MVESALEFVRICEKNKYFDLILSMKSSNPKVMIAAYRLLAARMAEEGMDYPFHLGVTEAGDGEDGRIKSAIGIGSLLEDGIGDTIRVSLTEDPEFEIPVCREIAALYQNKENQPAAFAHQNQEYAENSYHYSRRKTREIQIGPFKLGGGNTVRLISDFIDKKSILSVLEDQLKDSKSLAPEIVQWTIRNDGDLKDLEEASKKLAKETSRLAFLGRFEDSLAQAEAGLSLVQCAIFKYGPQDDAETRKRKFTEFLNLAKAQGVPVILEAEDCKSEEKLAQWGELTPAHNMLTGMDWALSVGMKDISLSFNLSGRSSMIHNVRYLAAQLREKNINFPIHLKVQPMRQESYDEYRIHSAIALGSLLCDGIGDSVQAGTGTDPKKDLELLYNILQAAGVRITKTEYVSCPSCGRTLFDLQSTTERIRSKTGHLKGVKIAIMGCIVNGPGEMADADFGYVGGAPGKINLYVGKECVEKNIPFEASDQRLIELIKEHGKWQDPLFL